MLNRKAIAILGAIFLLIIGTLGFLIYQRQTSKNAAQTNNTTPTTTSDPVTTTPDPSPIENPDTKDPVDVLGGAIKLTDDQVVSPVLFFQGSGVTYFNSNGQLFQSDLVNASDKLSLTNKRELTITPKSGISKILWPATGNNFIAEFQSGSNRKWSVYDSDKGTYVDMPSQVTSVSWLLDGNRIAYIWLDSKGKSTLNIANADNTDYHVIADMWENDDEISVSPDGQTILYYERQNPGSKNPINMTTPDGKVFQSVIKEGYNMGVLWSPNSKKFLFGKRDSAGGKYQLWICDLSSGEIKNLGVTGSVEKSIWSSDSQYIYSAIPTNSGSSGSVSQDKIIKIGASSGEVKEYDLKIGADARNLFFNSSGDALFFKNYQDGGLYYLSLKQ